MARIVDQHLSELLDDAERLRMCLIVASKGEWALLASRVRAGELVNPIHALYARSAYWEDLSSSERVLHMARALGVRHPTWVFSHATAAFFYGFWVS